MWYNNWCGCGNVAKLRRLGPGATLGFAGPSGAVADPEQVFAGARAAAEMGYRVKLGESCTARYGYLSGDDKGRAADLNRMFLDPEVDGVVCARGGYGAPRILDRLDYGAIARSGKALLGYSDITALHMALWKQCRIPTLHGPMPATEWARPGFCGFTRESLTALLEGRQAGRPLGNPPGEPAPIALKGGTCEGVLVGGNLSLVCALMGTPYMPDLRGCILFLEDVDEYLYRIDRMLTQLRLAGAFEACAGVVLGAFTNCSAQHPDRSLTLHRIVADCVLESARGPVLSGLMAGHCENKISLALGVLYRLDGAAGALTPLESPFSD